MNIIAVLYNKYIYRPLLVLKLKACGKNFKLGYSSEVINPQYFSFGDNFFAGPRSYFVTNANNLVAIGNAVMFGPDCKVVGGNHDVNYKDDHMYFATGINHMHSKINIEDGVWIGANSIVLSNANIGEGTVIGAMSLVNKEIPPYCIAAGIPAKIIKPRFQKKTDLEMVLKNVSSKYSLNEIIEIYHKHNIHIQ